MTAPIKTRERIVCAALQVTLYTVVPVPINQLPMDLLNFFNKQGWLDLTTTKEVFITTHGRTVTPEEAWSIAVHAGQVEKARTKGKLCVTDLFDFWNVK